MAESIREMVVKMSLDAGGFRKAADDIKRQISLVNSELKGMGGDSDSAGAKVKLLGEKLGMQKKAVENYANAVEQARKNLSNATTEADKLAKARDLSRLETDLTNAQSAAKKTADELNRLNALKFTQFGNSLKTMGAQVKNFGRGISMYISAPLAALGVGSYNAYKDFESAFTGVKKTVEETDTTKYEDLNQAFLGISEQIPVTYTELSALGEAAGALGVGADQVVKFVRTVADLSATTDDLDAQTGANVLARLLNITEQGDYSNIDRVGAALVDLGNKTAATEGEIAAMAQRMASTGELADFSTPEILALAAGFTSVGINAEAGGSAAGKLMKKMQLAAEVGGKAMRVFADEETTAGMSLREIQLAADDTKWLTGLADALQMTKKETKNLIDSGAALEQFSGVMGLTAQQYIAGWNQSSAQSMMAFFQGLASLEATQGEESILSMLAAMDLTEIRLSNLIAAAASNPQLFADALSTANQAYEENIALADEANKRYATTASQDAVRFNKMQNASADIGENIAEAVEPAKKALDGLLESFNGLSEVDQSRIVGLAGALIVLGPAVTIIGKSMQVFGSASKGIGTLIQNKDKIIGALSGIAASPIFQVVAAGAAIYALASFLDSIPTNAENILSSLANIQINIDKDSKDATLKAIAEVKAAADSLSGEKAEQYAGTSAAVAAGYGTDAMFGQALEYERMKAEKQVGDISAMYGQQINDLNTQIGAAVKAGDTALADSLSGQRDATQFEWDTTVRMARTAYTDSVAALINGMMLAHPEAKAAMEKASKEYDLLATLEQIMGTDAYKAAKDTDTLGYLQPLRALFSPEVLQTYFGTSNFEQVFAGAGDTVVVSLRDQLIGSISEAVKQTNEGSPVYTLLNALLTADGVTEMLDFSVIQGAFDGAVETLDFKQAVDKAKQSGNIDQFGKYLTGGLAEGVTSSAGTVAATMTTIRDATIKALMAAFAMQSPSRLMAAHGVNIPAGLAAGINAGAALAYGAMAAMQNNLVSQASRMAQMISSAFANNLHLNVKYGTTGAPGKTTQELMAEMAAYNARERAGRGHS